MILRMQTILQDGRYYIHKNGMKSLEGFSMTVNANKITALIAAAAALAAAVWVSGAAAQTAGTFTDTRDGKTYRTVKIGEQVWMAAIPSVAFATDPSRALCR
jgi:hypothetical protein